MTTLRQVEAEGVAVVCSNDHGAFPFCEFRVDIFGDVWHDGSEFGGDIVCHGPFSLRAIGEVDAHRRTWRTLPLDG